MCRLLGWMSTRVMDESAASGSMQPCAYVASFESIFFAWCGAVCCCGAQRRFRLQRDVQAWCFGAWLVLVNLSVRMQAVGYLCLLCLWESIGCVELQQQSSSSSTCASDLIFFLQIFTSPWRSDFCSLLLLLWTFLTSTTAPLGNERRR